MSATTVGVIGTGRIGTPLVARLVAAGHRVVATDIRAERRHEVEATGAGWAQDVPALLDGDYLTDFGLDRCVDELEAVERSAGHVGTPHPLTSAVADVHRAALRHYGPVDGELMAAAWLEEQADARLRRTGYERA
jgi:3-hydroxyisobutyrate dehydrogenase-like beta-hydroxyacid dehydrogenase